MSDQARKVPILGLPAARVRSVDFLIAKSGISSLSKTVKLIDLANSPEGLFSEYKLVKIPKGWMPPKHNFSLGLLLQVRQCR